jgi:hypothetical protein
MKVAKWACMRTVIGAAVAYSYLAAFNVSFYQIAIRLGIAVGAIIVMFASLHGRLYSLAGPLSAIVLISALSGN